MGILMATLVVSIIGLLIGIALVFAGNRFHVETDERIGPVRECLPGNNCGACGQAGCDAVAEGIVAGTLEVNVCPVNTAENIEKIAKIMGVEAGKTIKKVAFVKCAGDCSHTSPRSNYVGIRDCRAAALSGLSAGSCDYGCLGFGSCVSACTYGAIHVHHGVAKVDPVKCMGCGACTKACPKGLLTLLPADAKTAVACSNRDKGAEVKKVCTAGCIGCKLCTKQCEAEAILLDGALAQIDPEKCTGCGDCAEKCPSKAIVWFGNERSNEK